MSHLEDDKKQQPAGVEATEAAKGAETAPPANGGPAPDELEKSRKEAAENYDRYLRVSADFDNYKKRMARERTDLIQYGNEKLIRDLLPVLDSLGRALDHATEPNNALLLIEGLRLVEKQFLTVLENNGVQPIQARGERFDPNFHEALFQVDTTEGESNRVVDELEKGYLLNGRLLRPSKVSVSKNVS
jgi:molecular chaperone GrpE